MRASLLTGSQSRRFAALVAAMCAVVLVLAACSPASDDDQTGNEEVNPRGELGLGSMASALAGDVGAGAAASFATGIFTGIGSAIWTGLFGEKPTLDELEAKKTLGQLSDLQSHVQQASRQVTKLNSDIDDGHCLSEVIRELGPLPGQVEVAAEAYLDLLDSLVASDSPPSVVEVEYDVADFQSAVAKLNSKTLDNLLGNLQSTQFDKSGLDTCLQAANDRGAKAKVGTGSYYQTLWTQLSPVLSTYLAGQAVLAQYEQFLLFESDEYQAWAQGRSDEALAVGSAEFCEEAPEGSSRSKCDDIQSQISQVRARAEKFILAAGLPTSPFGTQAQALDDKTLIWVADLHAYDPCGDDRPLGVYDAPLQPGQPTVNYQQCGTTYGFPNDPLRDTNYLNLPGWQGADQEQLAALFGAFADDDRRVGDQMLDSGFSEDFQRTIIYAANSEPFTTKGKLYNNEETGAVRQVWPFLDTGMPAQIVIEDCDKTQPFEPNTCQKWKKNTYDVPRYFQGDSHITTRIEGWPGQWSEVDKWSNPEGNQPENDYQRMADPQFYYWKDGDNWDHAGETEHPNAQMFRLPVIEAPPVDCSVGVYSTSPRGQGANKAGYPSLCGEDLQGVMKQLLPAPTIWEYSFLPYNKKGGKQAPLDISFIPHDDDDQPVGPNTRVRCGFASSGVAWQVAESGWTVQILGWEQAARGGNPVSLDNPVYGVDQQGNSYVEFPMEGLGAGTSLACTARATPDVEGYRPPPTRVSIQLDNWDKWEEVKPAESEFAPLVRMHEIDWPPQ